MVTAVVLVIGGGQYYIFLNSFQREGVWVFFALGILSCSLALSFMARICISIQPKKENKQEDGNKDKKISKIASALKPVIARYKHFFDVNGKYYLTKMYASEVFEDTQQVYSLTTIYVCLMPVEISSVVCAVLTVELLSTFGLLFTLVLKKCGTG